MHPLLRTLDLTAGAGAESSVYQIHPILQAAAPRSWRGPFLLSLGLTPLLVYGLSFSFGSPSPPPWVRRDVDQARRSVAFLLQESLRTSPSQGPTGQGHTEGTHSRDPRLAVARTTLSQPPMAIDPEELGTSPLAERVGPLPDLGLPLQEGGNGLVRGTGKDAGRNGLGRDTSKPPGRPPDMLLVPIKQVTPYQQLERGQEDAARVPVRVRIVVGEDGIPIQATAVSGPVFLHAGCEKAALAWRFEPLGPHGLKAPYSQLIIFNPTWVKPR
jgi:hypothetical protein